MHGVPACQTAGVQDRLEADRRGFYDGEQLEFVLNGQPLRPGNRK